LGRMRRRDPDGKTAEEMNGGCRVLCRPASGRAQAADNASPRQILKDIPRPPNSASRDD
jgi:hypothetical protein